MQIWPDSIGVFRNVDSSIREVNSCITRVDSHLKWKSTLVLEKSTPKLQWSNFLAVERAFGSHIYKKEGRNLEKANALSFPIFVKHTQVLKQLK